MSQANTELQESAQAFFCFIADDLGQIKTKKLFAKYYQKAKIKGDYDAKKKESKAAKEFFEEKVVIDALAKTNVTNIKTLKNENEVKQFIITKKEWFISSMRIAEKLVSDVSALFKKFPNIKAPSLQGIYYAHGDDVVMANISKLFSAANQNSGKKFGNINKWCPADIYFASKDGKITLSNLADDKDGMETIDITNLNAHIVGLIKGGHLLPISLKLVKDHVILEKVNINMTEQERLITSIRYEKCTMNLFSNAGFGPGGPNVIIKKISKSSPEKSSTNKKDEEGYRDMRIYFDVGGPNTGMSKKKANFHIRHVASSGGKPSTNLKVVLQYAGSSAQHGQLASIDGLCETISKIDSDFGRALQSCFNSNYNNYKTNAEKFINNLGGKEMYKSKKKEEKLKFNHIIGALSAKYLMDPFRKEINGYFNNQTNKRRRLLKSIGMSVSKNDRILQEIFTYASSRSPGSAPFLVAKD